MSIKREESFTPTPEDLGSPLTADSPGSPESGDKRKKDLTLPLPAGALPPRKRAKTENEKEQRRIERIMRNRQAAHASREKKRRHLEDLEKKCSELSSENNDLHHQVTESKKANMHLMEQHYSLVAKLQQLSSLVNMAKSSGALAGVDVPDVSDVSMAPKLEMPIAAPSQPMGLATAPTLFNHDNETVVPDSPIVKTEEVDSTNFLLHTESSSPPELAESTGSGSPSSTLSCDETDYLVDRAPSAQDFIFIKDEPVDDELGLHGLSDDFTLFEDNKQPAQHDFIADLAHYESSVSNLFGGLE
ncbi:Transcriptional activator HAC1 [Yarrowia sp. C11]|nr:Transcriptional activator HAC1 [Yarrowia sp. E02]KAG5372815.1 Transcriptional activator HAC1 [Yarrowia sp. C11]